MNVLWSLKSLFYHTVRNFPIFRRIVESEKKKLRELIPASVARVEWILDIGTGTGTTLDIFPVRIPVIAVDRSVAMLKQAGRQRQRVIRVVADAHALPFRRSCIPFCSCIGVTEYLPLKAELLTGIRKILNPSAFFLLTSARPSIFNLLRNLLGHRLYPLPAAEWDALFSRNGFMILGFRRTWMQMQWLVCPQIGVQKRK